MTDQEIIKQAYADTLRNLYALFFDALAVANSADDRTKAEQRFKAGVSAARSTRDRALALL